MTYKDFVKNLKHNMFHNVIVLYGKENYLINWAKDELCKKYAECRENITDLAGEETSIPEVISMASTPSMFGGQRVILVRNLPWLIQKLTKEEQTLIDTEGKLLLDFAERTDPMGYLVFTIDSKYVDKTNAFKKKLITAASSYDMDTLTRPELIGFIGKRVKDANKIMTSRQLNQLIDATGYLNKDSEYRLDDLQNDLDKIFASGDGENIADEEIEDLVAGDSDKYIFTLIDALLRQDRKKAMTMLQHTFASSDSAEGEALKLTGLLTSQLEMMYDALTMEENGISMSAMIKALGVNKYRFEKAYKAARRYPMDRMKELLITLYNCDRDLKFGNLDAAQSLEMFILHV